MCVLEAYTLHIEHCMCTVMYNYCGLCMNRWFVLPAPSVYRCVECAVNIYVLTHAPPHTRTHTPHTQCQPNLVVYSVWIECLDKRLPRIAFFTTRNISSGEELTFDYHMNHNQSSTASPGRHKKTRMKCLCEADKCLGYYHWTMSFWTKLFSWLRRYL